MVSRPVIEKDEYSINLKHRQNVSDLTEMSKSNFSPFRYANYKHEQDRILVKMKMLIYRNAWRRMFCVTLCQEEMGLGSDTNWKGMKWGQENSDFNQMVHLRDCTIQFKIKPLRPPYLKKQQVAKVLTKCIIWCFILSIKKMKRGTAFHSTHKRLNTEAKKILPDLHTKTHFQAATSIFLQHSGSLGTKHDNKVAET
jgi:hypothetical protein